MNSEHTGGGSTPGLSDELGLPEGAERSGRPRLSKFGRGAGQVLWPAFMGAAMSVGLFFSAIDPLQIELVGLSIVSSRPAAYTLGFFLFWMLFVVSGTITWFLANTDNQRIIEEDRKRTGQTPH
ncbi:MAG: hypothetical protein AB8C46_12880 [Burkholderiaceae bacterium]